MMTQAMRSGSQQRWGAMAFVVSLLLALLWLSPTAKAEGSDWVGKVETMPAGGGSGAWTVGGRLFTATNATEFRAEKGGFAVGVCVEVAYTGTTAPFQAIKMATKNSDNCGPNTTPTVPGTPNTTTTPEASQTPFPNGEQEARGRVNRLPVGLIGEWLIGGVAYRTTVNTEFNFEAGPVEVGSCVKLHFVTANHPFLIRELETAANSDCSGVAPTGVPTVPSANTAKAEALIDAMPARGLMGIWTIGSVQYQVAPGARLRQEGGPFAVGACVEVEYVIDTTPRQVRKLETERGDDCSGATPVGTPTLVPTAPPIGTPGAQFELYGRVESLPANLIGNWVINGVTYVTTSETKFEHERGAFAVGRCVKIQGISTTTPATIQKIENERGFHCAHSSNDEFQGEGVLFGKIQSLPDTGLLGEWNIGGMTFIVTDATKLDQEHGQFALDVTVKVHFVVDANGNKYAREIEAKFANNEDGHDHDGDGRFEGAEGHAFGTIESMPADLLGAWTISGITYMVTVDTHFVEPHSDFGVGAKVRVKYYTSAEGERIVRMLKTTNEHNGADDASHSTLFAFVDQMPPSGFVGTWVLDNIAFVATAQTQFTEENGTLGVGAYVKIEYFIQDGRNIIHELETEVPPGAGDDSNIGEVESTGEGLHAASANGTVWVIGGKSYTVTPATDLNDLQSALTVGSTALVNSYTAADGSQVATQILGITLNNHLYLPLVNR